MEDDLRGLGSRAGPHGVKRSRADLSDDDEDSDDEPTPKRDRLLEELCNLQSANHTQANLARLEDTAYGEAIQIEPHQSRPPEDLTLPLRGNRKIDQTTDVEERHQQLDPKRKPDLSLTGSKTKEGVES